MLSVAKNGIRHTARTKDDQALTFSTKPEAKTYLLHLDSELKPGYTDGNKNKGFNLLRDRIEFNPSGAQRNPKKWI